MMGRTEPAEHECVMALPSFASGRGLGSEPNIRFFLHAPQKRDAAE